MLFRAIRYEYDTSGEFDVYRKGDGMVIEVKHISDVNPDFTKSW